MGTTALLLGLLMEVALALGGLHRRTGDYIPGAPVNISKDDAGLQRVLLDATYLYNNQSNDAFLYRPFAIIGAQRQVVKGFKYMVDFEFSRTVCRKRDAHADLSRCDFQPNGPLHQTLRCQFSMWVVPWEKVTREVLTCNC